MSSWKPPFFRVAYVGMYQSNPFASGKDLLPMSKSVVSWLYPVISSCQLSSWDPALLKAAPSQWLSKMVIQRPSHFHPTQDSPSGQSLLSLGWQRLSGLHQWMLAPPAQFGFLLLSQRHSPLNLSYSSLSQHLLILPEEHNWWQPASFVALGRHMTQFWPVRCKWKWLGGSLEKYCHQKQFQLTHTFCSLLFLFFLPGLQMRFKGWSSYLVTMR